jgi:hypothetical protein
LGYFANPGEQVAVKLIAALVKPMTTAFIEYQPAWLTRTMIQIA